MSKSKGTKYFRLPVGEKGGISVDPDYAACGWNGQDVKILNAGDLSPLPQSAMTFFLPGRMPVGINGKTKKPETLEDGSTALSAAPPPGYTRTYFPAYRMTPGAPPLPLWAYSAVGEQNGRLYMAAVPTELIPEWDPKNYNTPDLNARIEKKLAGSPRNRLLVHLSHCALEYGCFTAQNIFYERWEGGIPVSPACNAACPGCLSGGDSGDETSPQARITFIPTEKEILEIMLVHLGTEKAIVSFGQGCEGEPTLQDDLLEKVIKKARRETDRGTININTNGGMTDVIKRLGAAGLDSIRVSLNSCTPEIYEDYFKPKNYGFKDVTETVKAARSSGLYVSLNLLFAPGINDREEEIASLIDFCADPGVDKIQIRNLNQDPEKIYSGREKVWGNAVGVTAFLNIMKKELPGVKVGNFSPSLDE
ncbi:MAG: radical SAM protein [Chloroflexi bacterium]|nr:radical SAM protein [Chloroflexota bacterium]